MDGTVQCEELSKAWVEPIHRWFAIDLKRNQEDWDKPVFLGSVVGPSSARRMLIKNSTKCKKMPQSTTFS